MSRSKIAAKAAISALQKKLCSTANQSERTLLLATVLTVSMISALVGYVLTQYYALDVTSSLVFAPEDCLIDSSSRIGRHCFSDYQLPVSFASQPNPWAPYPLFLPPDYQPSRNNYSAASMLPQWTFGLLASWLQVPRLGLLGYLLVLTLAVLSPAVWAARGARGLERIVVFVACGAAAVPAWMAVDRGNSVGFVAPIGLAFLIGLYRQRYGLVTAMVVLAALVKPQFAVLVMALFALRQWRFGAIAVVGVLTSNVAAYLLWPSDFPATIIQSLQNALNYGSMPLDMGDRNVSFGKGLLLIPDMIKSFQTGGEIPVSYFAAVRLLSGYVILAVIVLAVLLLGPRIPPVLTGVMLLAGASLFPALVFHYYLVFVLPIAALIVRHPDGPPGSGLFDYLAAQGTRRVVGLSISLAVALSIVQVAASRCSMLAPVFGPIPGHPGMLRIVGSKELLMTSLWLVPVLWLVACAATILSYARRPVARNCRPAGRTWGQLQGDAARETESSC